MGALMALKDTLTESRIIHEKFGYVVRILLYLLKEEKQPSMMDFLEERIVPRATFYNHLKKSLEVASWVEFRVNPDRSITMHLTQKGRKIAQALASIENELKEAGVV